MWVGAHPTQAAAALVPVVSLPSTEVNYELSLPALRQSLTFQSGQQRRLPIVTGFLGRGLQARGALPRSCRQAGCGQAGAAGMPAGSTGEGRDGVAECVWGGSAQ